MKKRFLSSGIIIVGIFGLALTAYAAPAVNSAKVTNPNTIVITYSVPVKTSFGDYSNFTNSLGGRTLSNLSGNGTSVVTLTFTGSPFAADAHGTLSVASTTVAAADNSAYTAGDVTVLDGQKPQLTNFTVNVASANSSVGSAVLPETGDTITLTFSANESVVRPPITLAGHTVYPSGDGTGPFNVTYNYVSNDPQGTVPFSFNLTDLSSNSVPIQGTLNLTGNATVATAPAPTPTPAATAPATSGPTITQVTPVPDPSPSATPTYMFNSTEAGTINYGGDCVSSKTAAVAGVNSITFNSLSNGTHNNCVITLTDGAGLTSNTIFVPGFTVGSGAAAASTPQTPAAPAPLTSDGFKFTKLLQLGMTNNDVLELQKRLTVEGVYTGPVTGKFGAQTRAAVIAYQKAHGLDQKGWVGPGTRAALNGQ